MGNGFEKLLLFWHFLENWLNIILPYNNHVSCVIDNEPDVVKMHFDDPLQASGAAQIQLYFGRVRKK